MGTSIISPSPFFKLYAADVGVTAPHNATLGVSLPAVTAKPVGTFEMNGYTGWDAIFYGAPTAKNFKYEVVYYYRLQPEGANPAFGPMWVPLQFCTSAVDNNSAPRRGSTASTLRTRRSSQTPCWIRCRAPTTQSG